MTGKPLVVLVAIFMLCGCGSTYKERRAPCTRSTLAVAYGPPDRLTCGPATPINQDRSSVLAAIDAALRP